MKTSHHITVNGKVYSYSISESDDKDCYFFVCKAARIEQDFLKEDIPALLLDLPELIVSELEYEKSSVVRFRVNAEEKKEICKRAAKAGYPNVSSFLRDLALKG